MAEKAEIVLSAKDSTATAFQQVQGRLSALKATLAGVAGGATFEFLQKGAELVAKAFEKIDPRSVIDAGDQLDKLSQRTGIAVENLSAYQYQAKLADVSSEDLANSLKKLNINIAAAARGEAEQANAFKAIGVAVKDANGQVRSADDVLADIADRFKTYNDGANKVAIANAVGGKSFEKLIPFLNQGKQGIADARIELEQFGGVLSGDFARKSDQFNSNLIKLATSADALKISLASGLIDTLVEFSDQAVVAAKSGTKLEFAWNSAKNAILSGPGVAKEFIFGKALPPDKIAEATASVAELTGKVATLQEYLAKNPGAQGVVLELQLLTQRLNEAKAVLTPGPGGTNTGVFTRTDHDSTKVPTPKEAPALPKTGGNDDAEALLRKQLEGRIKAIQSNLEKERDLFQFSQSQLAELYAHGDLSIQQFYDDKSKAQEDFLAKQIAGFQAEIAAQQAFSAKATKPQDRQEAANKIVEANAQIAKAVREAGQASEVAGIQEQRAFEEAAKSLLELDAQIAELGGDKFGAQLDRNAIRLQEFQKSVAKVGGDPARVAAFKNLIDLQAKFADAQEQSARITEKAQTAEDAFILLADRSGKSRLETEQGIKALREASLAQLDALIVKTAELTKDSTDPELLAFYEKLKLTREKAFDAKDPALLQFRDIANQTGQSLATGLDDAIVDGKKFSDVVKGIEKDFLRLITHDFLTSPLATSFTNWIKDISGIGGQQSGGLGGGDLFSGIAKLFGFGGGGGSSAGATGTVATDDALALFFHGGGLAGQTGGTLRAVNPGVFAHAQKYHGGGLAGDEVPAILRRREEILTEDDPRHRDNWKGGGRAVNVTNHFHLQQPASRDTQSQVARRAGLAIQQALARDN